ncbi:centromere protein C-like [Hypanus sabinus]|uniref:centromere protein C-like n=1 Tax=Hypanus sabinus TaxID=79690 RepID=UPI0028C48862|nr:centromere protein C-like [Hypanus sabinus]
MNEQAALPRLELPKQPYRSRFYRDNAFGRLTGKPMNIVLQKNANPSSIVNNFLAGLDSINNTGPQLDSTSHFEVQFSEGKNPMNEPPKDLQYKKSIIRTQLQPPESSQSHQAPEYYTVKEGENNGSSSSKKQTALRVEPVAIVSDKANAGDNGDGVFISDANQDGKDFDEPERSLLIDVEALVLEADASPEKFGTTYDVETSVVNSTPYPSKPSQNSKPNMRLCFNTSVTPIAVKSPNIRAQQKIVSNALGVEEPKTLSSCFRKKPTVLGLTQPPQVEPLVLTPKCNDFEFELVEEGSFCFESWTSRPRKALSQKPIAQEKKSILDVKNITKKEKHQKADGNQVAASDVKQREPANEHLPLKQSEDAKSCQQNKQGSSKSSVCTAKNNTERELQNEPSAASRWSLTSKKRTELGYAKQRKSREVCVKSQENRDDCEAFQEDSLLCLVKKTNKMDSNALEQGALSCKNSAEAGSSTNLAKADENNRKMPSKRLCSRIDTPSKQSLAKRPISDPYTKCVDLESMPLAQTTADNNDIDESAGFETYQLRKSVYSGKNKETTIVNGSPALSKLPQKIKSKSLNTSKTPGVLSNFFVSQQKGYPSENFVPSENVVPSTSGLEKQQKEAPLIPQARFGIKSALSALPHPVTQFTPVTPAPNTEFVFESEEEENFCFKSWITIPKKAFVQKQDPVELEKERIVDAKTTKNKERKQKATKEKTFTIQSKISDKNQLAQNIKNKAKYENQSRKRPAYPLKSTTEKEQKEVHNESSFHSPPRQKKLKSARPRKKSIVESDRDKNQKKLQEELHQEPHFYVTGSKNRTEKAELFDQSTSAYNKFLESNSINLASSHSKHLLPSDKTKLEGKKGRQRKKFVAKSKRAKEQEEIKARFCVQENENGMEESGMSKQNTIPKNPSEYGYSVKDYNEKKSKLPLFAKSGSESKKRTKKKQKQNRTVNKEMAKKGTQPMKHGSSKKSLPSYHEPEENPTQDNAFNVHLRSRRLIRPPSKWWVVQHSDNDLQTELNTNYSPEREANLQGRSATLKFAKSQMKKKMVMKTPSFAQLDTEEHISEEYTSEKDVSEDVYYPDSPPGDHVHNISNKKQGRKQKYTSASTKPKKRLFSEAEEEKAKSSDRHQRKKQKFLQKQKVHDINVHDKTGMEQNENSDELTDSAHVSPTSRETKHLTSLSSKPTKQKPFQKSLESFSTTSVVKIPQKPAHESPETISVSSGAIMSPRKSNTRLANQPCMSPQVSSFTPHGVAVSTGRYQNKTIPSQKTLDENEEGDECTTPLKGKRTLERGQLCSELPVFNKSGPGPTVNYQESSDAGESRHIEHEVDNNEKKPPEGEGSLKSTRVWSEKESSEIFMDCVKTSEMCNFFYPLRTEYDDNRSIAICKSLNMKAFSCGKLVLGPYKEKGCQMVYKDTMVFHILKGDLRITIYRTTYYLKEGDYFFVPSGNTYNVTNLQDTEAVLLFTQLKGATMM